MSIPNLSRLTDAELSAWVRNPAAVAALPEPPKHVTDAALAMAVLLAGECQHDACTDDVDADGCGGLLVPWDRIPARPGARLIEGCADINALADDLRGDAL